MVKFLFVYFFIFANAAFGDSGKMRPFNLKVSIDGLHSKFRSRELIFKDNETVYEKKR